MTPAIGFLLVVLAIMVLLFLTEKLPIDLTAFLGLVVLVFAGYVTPDQAFEGFASSAVITMLSIFIISAALLQTGVADALGGFIHKWVGSREIPVVVTVMLSAGVLSAFMNNIAATAVLMPAVASLGRKSGLSPSRLFMPLAFGAILGGTTTLVGTPPNILAGEILEERDMEPFALFDFAPVGLALLAIGILFMVTIGGRLLPRADGSGAADRGTGLADLYRLKESLFRLRIPPGSRLDGVTLGETRIGAGLGLQIVSIARKGLRQLAPTAETVLRADDELLVQGDMRELQELLAIQGVDVEDPKTVDLRTPKGVSAIEARILDDSWFVGKTLQEAEFRDRFGVNVIAIKREGQLFREGIGRLRLVAEDRILGIGTDDRIGALAELPDFEVIELGVEALSDLRQGPLFVLTVPSRSPLVGVTISKSRVGELMGLTVAGIVRGERGPIPAMPEELIEAGDRLLVSGERSRVAGLLALGDARLESEVESPTLESEEVGVFEATVSPRSSVVGKTLAQLEFRDRYGLQVLGFWRDGLPIREGLGHLALREGDALLLQGPRDRLRLLAQSSDFVVLDDVGPVRRSHKAPFALAGLALMILFVVTGIQPIAVAAFAGATFVILSGAITMEEARREIEWRAIFLVAAVLPVGAAMQSSGAAEVLAGGVVNGAGPYGPHAVLASLIVLSSFLSQGLDGAPAVVLLSPVVLQAAEDLGVSPYPLMMGVSLAASAAFMTPFSHKANLLVMGLGGYRSVDYLRVGTPLTVVLLAAMVFLVPIVFPF